MSAAERTRWLLNQRAAGLHGRKLPLRFLVDAINRTAKELKDQAFADFAERHAHNPDRPLFERHRFFVYLQLPPPARKVLRTAEIEWKAQDLAQGWSTTEQREQHESDIDQLEHEFLGTVDLEEKERSFQELLDEISSQTGLTNHVDEHGSVWLSEGTTAPWRLAVAPDGADTKEELMQYKLKPITLKRSTLFSAFEMISELSECADLRYLCDPVCNELDVSAPLYGDSVHHVVTILSGVTGTTAHILKDGLVLFTARPSFIWRALEFPERPELAQELAQIPVPEFALNQCPLRDALTFLEEAHGVRIEPRNRIQMAMKISIYHVHNTTVARELEVMANLYDLSFKSASDASSTNDK